MISPNSQSRPLKRTRLSLVSSGLVPPQRGKVRSSRKQGDDAVGRISSEQKIAKRLINSLDKPFIDLSGISIPEKLFQIIPERIARKEKIVPFAIDEHTLSIATIKLENYEIFTMLEKKTGRTVRVYLAIESDIDAVFQTYQKNLQTVIDELIQKELGNTLNVTNDLPIIHIIDLLIASAHREKASDIHIEAEEENVLIRFRIDGILHDMLVLDKSLHSSVVTRIKVLANLRIDEHLVAQDGKMRVQIDKETIDVRISVIPTTEGEKVVLRILSATFRSFSLADLGMSSKHLAILDEAIHKSHGMILSTGPTGSGKTTSIYSLIKILNTREVNITTIEDPVEYRIKGVNHIPVNVKTGLTFASGLRSLLRQDPNVIFVGEIRDSETAGLAINASLTGHLVLSTLHTNDAATALPRLIDLKVEPFLISSTINVILAQRLVRKICEHCKIELTTKRSDLRKQLPEKFISHYFGKKETISTFHGQGCKACRMTGYSGRVGLFEILEITDAIRELIVQKKDATVIQAAARREGMTTLLDDGIGKIKDGRTTLTEVVRVLKIESL
jgi:type IV pilus assembly protein PilB